MNPILFHIPWFSGPIPYHAYGFFLAVAFLVGISLAVREGGKEGMKADDVVTLAFVIIVTSLVGSRLLHLVMAEPRAFFADPAIFFQFTRGGYAFYGGFVLGMVAMYAFCRLKRWTFLHVADVFTVSGVLGLAFGRTGCLLAGCCHGRPIEHPLPDWLATILPFQWPAGFSLTFPSQAAGLGGLLDQALVPTQPISGLYCIVIYLFLALWLGPRKRYHGQQFVWFCILYATCRFTVELLRGDDRGLYFGDALSTSQIVGVPVVLTGIGLLLWARARLRSGAMAPLPADWREKAAAGAQERDTGRAKTRRKKKKR